jgi:hypothetical protein
MNTVRWIISTAPENLSAAGGSHRNQLRPRQNSRVFDRHDGVPPDRGRLPGTARPVHFSISAKNHSLHPVRIHHPLAESRTPVLGVAVPCAVGNVVLTVLGPIIVACIFVG